MIVPVVCIASSTARDSRSAEPAVHHVGQQGAKPDDGDPLGRQHRGSTEEDPVIPSGWDVVRRPDDGELVGYLVPLPGAGDLVVPVTLTGAPAGAGCGPTEA